ncbi:Stf0 family sulfotransferase [Sulfuriroseicoccus oceanibius]|uniref:Sulphotransferase Stf0 domain-containing protein n=1 Tax=Sulfuriroseicoccus oceanibius TaxID=2707525 RepID=A0A6B3LAV7_9BACT|nr:Stf0 family sulfotransferase [Sulfuriroseicoccus oceanibius]QQL45622.1 hypothetical protein G3M56_003265 [Sulfuriroseicoccus oceanibius]
MALYKDQFNGRYDFPVYEGAARKFVVIASTGRSGSHMLGHVMHETGAFGAPFEYFNLENLLEWKRIFGARSTDDVIHRLMAKRTSENGVFSMKLHYSHLLRFGGIDAFMERFPGARFIMLERQDVLRQAVSTVIARQTGVWIAGQEGSGQKPVYDAAAIDKALGEIILDTASWRYDLSTRGLRKAELRFEDFCGDVPGGIQGIADFCEVNLPTLPETPVTTKQSGAINAEWAERFIRENAGGSLIRRRWELLKRLV